MLEKLAQFGKEFMIWGLKLSDDGRPCSMASRIHKVAPDFNARSDAAGIRRKNRRFVRRATKLAESCLLERNEFHKFAPKHMEYTRSTKNWGFLSKLLDWFGYPDRALIGNRGFLAVGFPYDGQIPDTGIFDCIPDGDIRERMLQVHDSLKDRERRKLVFCKKDLRSKAPSWMPDEDLRRLWTEFSSLRKKRPGTFREISEDDLTEDPMYTHGVHQKGKLRPCQDFSRRNKSSWFLEKAFLPCFSKIIGLTRSLMSLNWQAAFPMFQTKSSLMADISNERLRKEIPAHESLMDDFIKRNYNAHAKGTSAHECLLEEERLADSLETPKDRICPFWGEKWKRIGSTRSPFSPTKIKEDFSGYYYQLQPDKVTNNRIAYWCPFGVDEDIESLNQTRRDATRLAGGRWRYFESSVLLFGSLHSVFSALRLSCAIAWVLDRVAKIIVDLYIDDTVGQSRAGAWKSDQSTVRIFYDLIGLTRAVGPGKSEESGLDGSMTILGIRARRVPTSKSDPDRADWHYWMAKERIDDAVKMINLFLASVDDKKAIRKDLEKLIGVGLFIAQIDPSKSGRNTLSELSFYADEAHFPTLIKLRKTRSHLRTLLCQLRALISTVKPLIIRESDLSKVIRHLYSDASLEAESGEDVRFCDKTKILFSDLGGCDRTSASAWHIRVPISSLPAELADRGRDIMFWEAVAAWLNNLIYIKGLFHVLPVGSDIETSGDLVVSHVDNMATTHGLVKGYCKVPATTAICQAAQRSGRNCWQHWAWITGSRNPADYPSRPDKTHLLIRLGIPFTHELDHSTIPWNDILEILGETNSAEVRDLFKIPTGSKRIRDKSAGCRRSRKKARIDDSFAFFPSLKPSLPIQKN